MIIIMNIYNNVIEVMLNHYHSPNDSITVFPEDDNMLPSEITNDAFLRLLFRKSVLLTRS